MGFRFCGNRIFIKNPDLFSVIQKALSRLLVRSLTEPFELLNGSF